MKCVVSGRIGGKMREFLCNILTVHDAHAMCIAKACQAGMDLKTVTIKGMMEIKGPGNTKISYTQEEFDKVIVDWILRLKESRSIIQLQIEHISRLQEKNKTLQAGIEAIKAELLEGKKVGTHES